MPRKYIQDAGHGGTDPGAVHSGNIEKVYTLEAAKYVDKRLAEHGIVSWMTRETDKTLDSGPRTAIVRKSGAQKWFSHHYNAGGGTGAEFIHSIYSDGKMEDLLAEEFEKAGFPVRRIFDRKGSNGQDYYYMHRETGSVDTTIIEYDFVDGGNKEKIKSKSYRERMYECVVKAACRYEGVKYKPLNAPKPTPKPTPTKPKEDDDMLERAIVINSFADFPNAELLANRLGCPIITRPVAAKTKLAKELIVCGGTKDGLKADKFTVLSGKTRYETAEKIAAYKG